MAKLVRSSNPNACPGLVHDAPRPTRHQKAARRAVHQYALLCWRDDRETYDTITVSGEPPGMPSPSSRGASSRGSKLIRMSRHNRYFSGASS